MIGSFLANLTGYLVAVDELDEASDAGRRAIGLFAGHAPDHTFLTNSIEHLALVDALPGNCVRAAALEGYAEATFKRLGNNREFTELATYGRLAPLLREGLSRDELLRLTAEGAALSPEGAIALALTDP